jgi:hypothetical protein
MRLSACLVVFALAAPALAYPPDTNFDESKAGTYTLPDPLVAQDGSKITSAASWQSKRRPEILKLFETHVYGRTPRWTPKLRFEVTDHDPAALGGLASRRQVTIHFTDRPDGPRMRVLVYAPANSRKPVPVFVSPSLSALHKVHNDPAIAVGKEWDRKQKAQVPSDPAKRGTNTYWQIEKVIARGYAVATFYYCDLEPDFDGGLPHGVRPLAFAPGQTAPAPDEWGAIGAWAWGMSRVVDYLQTDRAFDSKKIVLMGHSRLGKTALWAGAQDPRFAIVIANGSGEGGAALARRHFGETVRDMAKNFPFQFAANYRQYSGKAQELPVDSHLLLALIAPRPLYLGTALDDQWADPKGELLAARAAGPVYRLFGKKGLEQDELPALGAPIMNTIGFHYRTGKHEVTGYDWDRFLEFADLHFRR